MTIKIKESRHSVNKLYAHIVLVTKYRRKVLTSEILNLIFKLTHEICLNYQTIIIEIEGECDHIHVLIKYPPKIQLTSLIGYIKGRTSSIILANKYPEIITQLWNGSLWSPSYFISSCGGAPLEIIKEYINNQNRPE